MTPAEIKKMSDAEKTDLARGYAAEYYEFFRLGGSFSYKEFARFDSLQKAGALTAKSKVIEEQVRLQTKCTMALIDRLAELLNKKKEEPPKSEEEVAVSGVLDKMEASE